MLCLKNDEDLYINGNFREQTGSNFMIVFEKCNQPKTARFQCKTESEINRFLANKYIVTLENSSQFI